VASRYRALLIGNSTYPADEHNLQTLKGPVKDIAALNRALADPGSGLFDDADVTLLPEATSPRAIRALGRFFGAATRDDILLVYFSGHGKLDQNGRLHLCMQDTDSTDLLSTAVSSARINEFADASRARNVVIVLDCCHAGAFRGSDLGQAVAGPGRYVLTSCRGTQLANDATVENGTSFFTQHLVDGLLQAAVDQDQDGYITFSDLYAYVDRRLREAGKQIPQRRVDGDGDLPLARRQPTAHAAGMAQAPSMSAVVGPPASVVGDDGAGMKESAAEEAGTPAPGAPRPSRARPKILFAVAAAVAIAGGGIAAFLLLSGGSGTNSHTALNFHTSGKTVTAGAPWRLKFEDDGYGNGCSITVTDVRSGAQVLREDSLYMNSVFQIHQTGSFRWHVNDPRCNAVALPGSGTATLPFTAPQGGDSDAFAVHAKVAAHVKDFRGSSYCRFALYDPADGQQLDFSDATPGHDTVVLDPAGRKTVYVGTDNCAVQLSTAR
jgi:caspase domain-containing protein